VVDSGQFTVVSEERGFGAFSVQVISFLRDQPIEPSPQPWWFFAKSAEALENKRVESCVSAKKCKRVRKNLKTQGIARKHVEPSAGLNFRAWKTGGREYTPRHDEKSAEVIDKQRVEERPLRRKVRNPLKRKDLRVSTAERKTVQVEKIEIGEWQPRGRVA